MWILASSFGLYLFSLWKRPLFYAGLIFQSVYIISRGIALSRLPLVGAHDTLIFMTASLAAFAVPVGAALREKDRFYQTTAVAAALFTAFAMTAGQSSHPLPPVLKTFWFEAHVVLAFMSYALFGIGAILSGLYLQDRRDRIEGLAYRTMLTGYSFFSLSMIFGGIWAYLAWGTYWIWTPKELWTSILWIYYSFYLHARIRPWWTGRPAAWLGIIGFGVVLFTYLGVSLLMKSSHSF